MVPPAAMGLTAILLDLSPLLANSKAPGWLSQIVTESKLILLATRQANESKRRGVEARKMTLIRSQKTKKMAG